MNTAIIGIGSNIEPEKNIREAVKLLENSVTVVKLSEIVRTTPIGITDQPDFLNGAVKIITNFSLSELWIILKKTEDQLGRDRTQPKYGPRTIDLDLVVWNSEITDPDYYTRSFLRQLVDELSD
jgi:2-amino-4-hydroxy-6-hydroxymethyldihydropteridine diphosphokinase